MNVQSVPGCQLHIQDRNVWIRVPYLLRGCRGIARMANQFRTLNLQDHGLESVQDMR